MMKKTTTIRSVMPRFVAQDFTGGLAMVNSIHVDGYQLDMRGQFIQHLHYLSFIWDDAAVHFGKLRKDCTAAVHHDVVGIEPFHRFADARFPFAIAHSHLYYFNKYVRD
jgi:hypothetical protein